MINAFAAIANESCKILILGSMPGVVSLDQQQYYAHPRNAFWSIMKEITDTAVQADYPTRCQSLLEHNIALWDVLAQCRRQGSLDSAIETDSVITNDFAGFFRDHPTIQRVILNGNTAFTLFKRHVVKPDLCPSRIDIIACPSTSPANARLTIQQKTDRWLPHLL